MGRWAVTPTILSCFPDMQEPVPMKSGDTYQDDMPQDYQHEYIPSLFLPSAWLLLLLPSEDRCSRASFICAYPLKSSPEFAYLTVEFASATDRNDSMNLSLGLSVIP
jgi:hypothetical protein